MNGIEIEYLLGLYFSINSINWKDGRIEADAVKLIAGIVLFVLAFVGKSFI